jgi:hypothetical protein
MTMHRHNTMMKMHIRLPFDTNNLQRFSEEPPHANRLGLLHHSRESGNPEAGQPGRLNKMMKMDWILEPEW